MLPPTIDNGPRTCIAMGKGYPDITTRVNRLVMGEYAVCNGDFDTITLGGV